MCSIMMTATLADQKLFPVCAVICTVVISEGLNHIFYEQE